MNNIIPVVFIHHGREFEWMDCVLSQSRKYNETTYLIGDQRQRTHDIKDYFSFYDKFRAVFQNHSSNPEWFEGAAFSRWFILSEFMDKNNIDVAFHLDTDVLLYANTELEYPAIKDYPLTLVVGNCGATVFVTRERIRDFCEYVLRTYTDKNDTYKGMVHIYSELVRQGLDGGISDMLFWEFYRKQNNLAFYEMTDIVDGATWDHTMLQSNPGAFQMRNGVKDIHFQNGLPYGTQLQGGEIRFKSLHFQGTSDRLIEEYAK